MTSLGQNIEQIFLIPFISIIAFIIFWFIIGILLCVWVYRDAESRGMDGTLWLIIVLITNIVGLIIYLIVREERKPLPLTSSTIGRRTRFCAYCGKEVPLDAKFCPNCGKAIME